MSDAAEMLKAQEAELERIRNRRRKKPDGTKIRKVLNILFLLFAAIGLAVYFSSAGNHVPGLAVIGLGMLFKVAEFFIRFLW